MITSSNRNISASLTLCEGNPPVTGEFPSQRPVTRSFDGFFDVRLKTYSWVNNWNNVDLSSHRAHYDVTVMNKAESFMRSLCRYLSVDVSADCGIQLIMRGVFHQASMHNASLDTIMMSWGMQALWILHRVFFHHYWAPVPPSHGASYMMQVCKFQLGLMVIILPFPRECSHSVFNKYSEQTFIINFHRKIASNLEHIDQCHISWHGQENTEIR